MQYILKETIRYNNRTYLLGEKASFTEEDLKIVAPYVELVKGETSVKVEEPITEEKTETKKITKRKATK